MANLIRLKQIEGSTELQAAVTAGNAISQSGGSFTDAVSIAVSQSLETSLSASIINIITNNVAATLPDGVISSSAQLDGTTIKNLTISTINADRYSLVISGAASVVDATNLSDSDDFENDTTVPGQIYLVSGTFAPVDTVVNGNPQSNIIDQGEW